MKENELRFHFQRASLLFRTKEVARRNSQARYETIYSMAVAVVVVAALRAEQLAVDLTVS